MRPWLPIGALLVAAALLFVAREFRDLIDRASAQLDYERD